VGVGRRGETGHGPGFYDKIQSSFTGRAAMIHKDMKIDDVLRKYPQTVAVFQRFGIDCADCQLSQYENLEHGAKVHKINLELLLKGLNESLKLTS
jgi:hybrid cluster-associated redox disulfide protein